MYHPLKIGQLHLDGNIFLAPVAGWTERVFRSLCVEQGANFCFTELISSEALVRCAANAEYLLRKADNEKHYAIQLFGTKPEIMACAARIILKYKPSLIDINAGCPVPKVTKTGAGSALMKDPVRLGQIVKAVMNVSAGVPVSVKIRSGWDAFSLNYEECALAAVEAGASMITLHPRTKTQGYEGKSEWKYIANLASRLSVPVAGSGDLWTPEDAKSMLESTGCAAIMFARGAMGNPFIFSETYALLMTKTYNMPSASDRMKTAFRHLELLARDIGETKAALEMRKVFCAYTKGITHGAALRNALVRAGSIAEYYNILNVLCR